MPGKRYSLRTGCLLIAVLIAAILLLMFTPMNTSSLVSRPNPTRDYAEALQRIKELQNQETAAMNPDCRLQFFDQGKSVERVIVFIHGYTNCPQQFKALGQEFYNLGYNGLILPLPHHGLADRMTREHELLTAEELVEFANAEVDLAQGLGDHVTLVGLSLGGTAAAWAAQTRSDVDLAVLISPGFGVQPIPSPLTLPVTRFFLTIPNSYQWWDPSQKEAGGLTHAYPRIATRAVAQILRLGFATREQARKNAPQAGSILIVTNANDPSVNNDLTEEMARIWEAHGAEIIRFEFGKNFKLNHDLIDPAQPDARTDLVYPYLIRLIDEQPRLSP